MIGKTRAFRCSKNSEVCQDAVSVNSMNGRFAVADGATNESVLQDVFAQFLVDRFTESSDITAEALFSEDISILSPEQKSKLLSGWGQSLGAAWEEHMRPFLARIPVANDKWNKDVRAQATFAGLHVQPTRNGKCRANYVVVGDACVLLAKPDGTPVAQPVTAGEPKVAHIGRGDKEVKFTTPQMSCCEIETPALAILATDELYAYLSHRLQRGGRIPVDELLGLTSQAAFDHWVYSLRESNAIGTDDVALVIAEIPKPGSARQSQQTGQTSSSPILEAADDNKVTPDTFSQKALEARPSENRPPQQDALVTSAPSSPAPSTDNIQDIERALALVQKHWPRVPIRDISITGDGVAIGLQHFTPTEYSKVIHDEMTATLQRENADLRQSLHREQSAREAAEANLRNCRSTLKSREAKLEVAEHRSLRALEQPSRGMLDWLRDLLGK